MDLVRLLRGIKVTFKPKILSLCDYTGKAVKPWADAGYECHCVDLQHKGIIRQGNILFIQADVRHFLPRDYGFAFAFPECTGGTVSSTAHWQRKGLKPFIEWLDLFEVCREIVESIGCPYVIEQPVVDKSLSNHYRNSNSYFNPCDYGGYLDPPSDAYTKKTQLWHGNGFVMPGPKPVTPIKVCSQGSWIQKLGGSSQKTKNLRSATPEGWAKAVFEANKMEIGNVKVG